MSESPYLDAAGAVAFLNLPSREALRAWLYRRRKAGRTVRTHRVGSRLRFLPDDLRAAMTVEEQPRHLRKVG